MEFSNGQPIIIRAAMKPIATTLLPQPTVDLASGTESPTKYERSDFCPVPRAVPILEAMVAFVLADALIEKLGGDSMNEMKPRFEILAKSHSRRFANGQHSAYILGIIDMDTSSLQSFIPSCIITSHLPLRSAWDRQIHGWKNTCAQSQTAIH